MGEMTVWGIPSNWKCATTRSVKLTVDGDTGVPGLSVTEPVAVEGRPERDSVTEPVAVEGRPERDRVTILCLLMEANSVWGTVCRHSGAMDPAVSHQWTEVGVSGRRSLPVP